jgi:hypothetical protein
MTSHRAEQTRSGPGLFYSSGRRCEVASSSHVIRAPRADFIASP